MGLLLLLPKYDANGNIIWARNGGRYQSTPKDMVFDCDGNLYYCGESFGNYGGTEMDFHLVKYNAKGDMVFQKELLVGNEYVSGLDIDNAGSLYHIGRADVKGIGAIGLGYVNASTAYVAKLNSGSTTRKRPSKPLTDRVFVVCKGSAVPALTANGSNIQWYRDSLLTNRIASGNNFQPGSTKTDTFYVTQTVGNIQSWPKQVIVYFSSLLPFSIERRNDSLAAPFSPDYTYQWYVNGTKIPDSAGGKQYGIKADTSGNFKVVVTDRFLCQQEASFVMMEQTSPITIIQNPAHHVLKFITGKQVVPGNVAVHIYDAYGNIVHSSSVKTGPNEIKEINAMSLKPGLYFLELVSGNRKYTRSFVKL